MSKRKIDLEALRYVIANWNHKPVDEIARHLGASEGSVLKWARELRQKGVNLPKRSRMEFYVEQAAREAKATQSLLEGESFEGNQPTL